MSKRTMEFGVAVGEFAAAGDGQGSFGFAIDDFRLLSQAVAHPIEKLGAVFGGAAGFRGDQARACDAARRHLVAANPQRLEGALDRRFAEPPGLRKPFAEAYDARERVDDAKPSRPSGGRPAAAIVGAQVQRGVKAGRRASVRRRTAGGQIAARRLRWGRGLNGKG